MILITFIKHNLNTDKKELDYKQFKTIEELHSWLSCIGETLIYSLTKNNRVLTPSGSKKAHSSEVNLLEVMNKEENILFKVQKVVSNDGILFESIKHCSAELFDYIALKRVKTN